MDVVIEENLRREAFFRLCDALRRNDPDTWLVEVGDLPFSFEDDDAIQLAEALEQSSHVQSIECRLSSFTRFGASRLGRAISREGTSIDDVALLVYDDGPPYEFYPLNTMLISIRNSSKLSKLLIDVDGLPFDDSTENLRDLLLECRTLSELSFCACELRSDLASERITEGIANSSVKKVSVKGVNSRLLSAVLNGLDLNTGCETLSLCFETECTRSFRSAKRFLELNNSSVYHLQLDMRSHVSCFRSISSGLTSNTTIKRLELKNGWISQVAASHLRRVLLHNSHIEKLLLYDCSFLGRAFSVIMEGLRRNRVITDLALRNNSLGPERSDALTEMLRQNECLRSLVIKNNPRMTWFTDGSWYNDPLDSCLEFLFLHEMEILDRHIPALSERLLEDFPNLVTLSLGLNSIEAHGCRELTELVIDYGLYCLMLDQNEIGDDGAMSLAALMRQCPGDLDLALSWAGIGDVGLVAIASALRATNAEQGSRSIRLGGNVFGDVGIDALTEAVGNSSFLEALEVTLSPGLSARTKERFIHALDLNNSIEDHDIDGAVDEQLREKIDFFGRRNKVSRRLIRNESEWTRRPGIWAHVLASNDPDLVSTRFFTVRSVLPGLLEN